MEIFEAAKQLVNALEESQSYRTYVACKEKMQEDEAFYRKVKDYQSQLIYHQANELQCELTFEDECRISKLYSELSLNEHFRNFINSEQELIDIFSKVHELINDSCTVFEI